MDFGVADLSSVTDNLWIVTFVGTNRAVSATMSPEHSVTATKAANFVLLFGITNNEPKLKVYIGHAQTMDPDRVGFVGILKCCVKEGRAFVEQYKPFHSQLGVAYLLFQIADLEVRKESNMAPRIWPFSSIQRQIEYGH
jgi:hypothetical protein